MYVICFAGIVVQSCNQHQPVTDNPFLIPFDTPFEVPPFDKIQNRHYLPAFREGIKEQEAGLGKLAPILLVQKAEPLALRKIGHRFLLHRLGMVVIHGHAACQQVVVEPDAAALGGVEIRALLFLLQQQLGVVL